MPKTAMIHARIEKELKAEVEDILKKLGLSTTEAINTFFSQVKLRKGLPFPVEIPNETTLKTFQDSEAGKGLVECKDADDMFEKLGV
jgi:DNA-damage-inducible protein J